MDTKGLLSSKTFWGLATIAVPYLDSVYQYLLTMPEGLLPAKAHVIVTGLGWVLALAGRMSAKGPIKGL